MREQALVIAEKNPGANDFLAKMALAGSHTETDRFEAALASIEAALPLARQIRGPEDLMTLNILSNLANHCEKTGRSAEAIEHGEELVAIRRKLDPDLKDHQTIWAMQALAAYYETAGEKE